MIIQLEKIDSIILNQYFSLEYAHRIYRFHNGGLFLRIRSNYCKLKNENLSVVGPKAESKEKHGVWKPMQ
jgi:hypothetical protein